MNLLFLESLVYVANLGSLAEAARAQGLTATAVSQRLKALEGLTGTALIARSGKTVALTEAGQRILPHARQVLDEQRRLLQALDQQSLCGRVELGVISTGMTGLLPSVLCKLGAKESPGKDLEVKLHPGTSAQLYNRMLQDELDAIVISAAPFALPKTLISDQLHQEPLCLIGAAGQITASDQQPKPEQLHDLIRQAPFIRYDRNAWGGRLVERYLRVHQIQVKEFCELDALEAIAVLVNSGLGLALVPDWPQPWIQGLKLDKVILPDTEYARQILLLRKRSSRKETAISYLAGLFKEAARNLLVSKASV
ncbi:LysR substrate-binding domain-containing protein [Kiloniella laminariae]|uniref:LysR substrate-binding domain-containing protein n=1 Tax=Kiloniella laminariae TaxID=454162 RepID=A0ABT4LKX7_9PROT|nr:LysR substrate-binding domain-containing protein [Kiloniella laminariae]MCZ4281729.1 LysR substrate-binding domain-containing protein [Kiloniella laminariae]